MERDEAAMLLICQKILPRGTRQFDEYILQFYGYLTIRPMFSFFARRSSSARWLSPTNQLIPPRNGGIFLRMLFAALFSGQFLIISPLYYLFYK